MQDKPDLKDFINDSKEAAVTVETINYTKKTYYLTKKEIRWIDKMACFEHMSKSEIVRKALESYIPDKYKRGKEKQEQ